MNHTHRLRRSLLTLFTAGVLVAMPSVLVGCAAPQRAYGDSSVGERWTILHADDPELKDLRAKLPREHGFGWATQVASYTFDDGPRDVIVGPIAFAGDDPRNISVSYSIFAEPPIAGRLVFRAVAQPPHQLPASWAEGVVRPVRMDKGYKFDEVVVPTLTVPTDALTIEWQTERAVNQDQP